MDLTFKSDASKGYGGGILIRSVRKEGCDKSIQGLLNTYWAIFGDYSDAFSKVVPNPYLEKVVERKGLDVVELHFDEKDPAFTYSWAYINFIQVGNVILIPALGTEQDNSAEEQISTLFPSCRIHRIKDIKRVLNLGGALHCISWNIKE